MDDGRQLAFHSTTSRCNRRNEVVENRPKAVFRREHLSTQAIPILTCGSHVKTEIMLSGYNCSFVNNVANRHYFSNMDGLPRKWPHCQQDDRSACYACFSKSKLAPFSLRHCGYSAKSCESWLS